MGSQKIALSKTMQDRRLKGYLQRKISKEGHKIIKQRGASKGNPPKHFSQRVFHSKDG